jgi:hypothetical protein
MSYRTNTFAHTPLRVSTSDAPYGLQLELAFTAFNDRIRPQSLPQHLTIDARVTLFTQEEATATVAELRSMADAIEAYAPKLKEK